MERPFLIRGILTVVAAFLCNFTYGRLSTFGNLSPYIASYLKYRTSNLWFTNGHAVWIFSMGTFFFGIMSPIGSLLEKLIGTRWTCLIGGWTMSFGILMTYLTIKYDFWAVVITYGVISGASNGFIYSVCAAAGIKWFPQHAGIVSGVVVSGYSIGSLVFVMVQTKFINPMNIIPNATEKEDRYFIEPQVLDRIPMYFLIMGGTYVVIQIAIFVMMSNREDYKASPERAQLIDETDSLKEKIKAADPHDDFTLLEAVKDKRFWIIFATVFFRAYSYITTHTLYKSFGQTFILNDEYFAAVGAVASVSSSVGRIVLGILFDRYSYKWTMSGSSLLSMCLYIPFYFSIYIKHKLVAQITYGAVVCMILMLVSDCFVLIPAVTSQCFGRKNLTVIFGCVFSSMSIVGIVAAVVTSNLLDFIHYSGIFGIATGCCFITFILTQFIS